MPTEDRRIMFTSEEVYKALYSLSTQKQAKPPPPGHITDIKQDEEDSQKILVTVENPQDTSTQTMDFTRDFLAAALLMFCMGLGIPIPKTSNKSVLVKDGQVMLRVTVS